MWHQARVGFAALLLAGAVHSPLLSGQGLDIEAGSVSRGDLPIGFPVQVLDSGFAVIEVTLTNPGQETVHVDPEQILVWSPGKKKLNQASTDKILPKLIKYYRAGNTGAGGEIYAGGPSTTRPGTPTPGTDTRGGSYSIMITRQLRVVLDGYRLRTGPLEPGESLKGYLYVKAKQRGRKLAGGRVALGDSSAEIE